MKSHRWNIVASSLPEHERYCTCCEKPLGAAARMLELDQRTDSYHDFRNVPEDKSQGWFVFGLSCARKKVAEAAVSNTSTVQPRERIVPHEDCLNCRCTPEEQCAGVSYTSPDREEK